MTIFCQAELGYIDNNYFVMENSVIS